MHTVSQNKAVGTNTANLSPVLNPTNWLKHLLFISIMALSAISAYAQPTVLYTSLTTTTPSPSNSRFALSTVGGFKQARFQSNQTATSGAQTWAFHQGTTGSTDYSSNWRPYTAGNTLSVNTYIPVGFANGARFNGGGGSDGQLPAITSGNYYTFNVSNTSSDNTMQLLETNFSPKTISSVTNSGTPASVNNTVLVTVTASAAPSTGENVFVRYTTNSYTASTLVQVYFASGATTGTAMIPCQSAAAAVSYYVYSSNKTKAQIDADVTTYGQPAHDMSTLNLNNNSGSNYTYTQGSAAITNFTGVYNISTTGCYTTLASFITGLNAGTVTGAVTVYVDAGFSETAPAGGLNITKTGTVSNTIKFVKLNNATSQANPFITAGVGVSAITDGIWKLTGVQYITVDGFTLRDTSTNATATTQAEYGFGFFASSTTVGSQNNTIQNCTIRLINPNVNTISTCYTSNNLCTISI